MHVSGARWLKVSALSAHTFDNAVVTAREDSTASIALGWGDAVTDERCTRAHTFGPRCALKDGWESSIKLLWNAMKV